MSTTTYTVRQYRPGDEHGILRLFNQVFGEDDPSFRPRTLEQWHWEFRDNPAGMQIIVAEDAGGRIVAHYACLPARTQLKDEQVLTGQGVDSMVHPDSRRGLKKEGPFLQVARAYLETFGNERVCAFGFGFPNEKAFRVGVRRIGYVPVVPSLPTLFRNFFSDSDDETVGRKFQGAREVREVTAFEASADQLWKRVRAAFPVALLRDSLYLNWRYARCARGRYRLFEVCDDGRLAAVFVTRALWQGLPILALADYLGDPRDEASFALALRQALRCARDEKQVRVEAWFPRSHPFFEQALEAGFKTEPSQANLCVMLFRKDLELDWLARNWFFTIGDSDLF